VFDCADGSPVHRVFRYGRRDVRTLVTITIIGEEAISEDILKLEQSACTLLAEALVIVHMAGRIDGTVLATKLKDLVRNREGAKCLTYCTTYL
jgi:hypothetical protein